ncbi:MAG: hypothetical protein ACKV2T_07640 [Kofleriaceae bacterium]
MTRVLAPLLVVLTIAAPAAADEAKPAEPAPAKKRTVGILDVRVDGVPDEARAQFESGLEEQLDTTTYWLSNRAQMRERLKFSTKWTEGCLVGACLIEVKTQTQAELVLLVALSGSGTSYGYIITVARTDNGKVVAQDSQRCDVCTPREVMRDATLATINLLHNVPDTLPDEAAEQKMALDEAVATVDLRLAGERARLKKRGLVVTLVGVATAAAGVAVYFLADNSDYAWAIAGAGGGLAVGGVAMLTF